MEIDEMIIQILLIDFHNSVSGNIEPKDKLSEKTFVNSVNAFRDFSSIKKLLF